MAYKISNEAQRNALSRRMYALQALGGRGAVEAETIRKLLEEQITEAPPPAPPKPKPPKPPAPAPRPPTPPQIPPTPAPKPSPKPLPEKPIAKPELIIERTPYPKWWKEEGTAPISLQGPGSQIVISARSDYVLYIAAIVLTVSDETNIVFTFGQFGTSGSMDLGGADEPRGLVIAMGASPAPCGSGSFAVTSDGADASVQGFVTYYLSKR
jgi:hypothetical protein